MPLRAFELEDPQEIGAALRDVAVVLNSAGPFGATARPLAAACTRAGAHYLDVAGELPVFQDLQSFDAAARAAGVMIMPGVGFVVAATDCLAAHATAAVPNAHYLRIGVSRSTMVSRGSYASMLGLFSETVTIRRDGRLGAVPVGWLERAFDYGEGDSLSAAVVWPDVFTAWYSTGIPNIEAYVEAGPLTRWTYSLASRIAEPLRYKPIQDLVALQTRVWPEGPSERQREGERRTIVVEVEDRYRRGRRARLHTPDGYSFTPLSALAIAERVLAGDHPAGFQTPASAYGADLVLGLPGVRREDATRFA
jgi:saccharopine dehydrogenase (NAD+, L-lysine-forming)